jgi:hypothetical protein
MPNPMIDPDGGLPIWFFRLSCDVCAVTSTDQFGYYEGQAVQCPGHGDVTVLRAETAEEVEARYSG